MSKVSQGFKSRQVSGPQCRPAEELPEPLQAKAKYLVAHLRARTQVDKIMLAAWSDEKWVVGLIVPTDDMARNLGFWYELERCFRLAGVVKGLELYVYGIRAFNVFVRNSERRIVKMLEEGYMLYDGRAYSLATPPKVVPAEHKADLERQFAYWYETANDFLHCYKQLMERGRRGIASFQLQQAVERYATTVLVVFGAPRRTYHDIEALIQDAFAVAPELAKALAWEDEDDDRNLLFRRLKKAYLSARYSPKFEIPPPELENLGEEVERIAKIIEELCRAHLAKIAETPAAA